MCCVCCVLCVVCVSGVCRCVCRCVCVVVCVVAGVGCVKEAGANRLVACAHTHRPTYVYTGVQCIRAHTHTCMHARARAHAHAQVTLQVNATEAGLIRLEDCLGCVYRAIRAQLAGGPHRATSTASASPSPLKVALLAAPPPPPPLSLSLTLPHGRGGGWVGE